MAIRPKEERKIKFKQYGTTEEKVGIVKRVLKPQFNRHLKNVQYVVICDGEMLYLEPNELIDYVK